MAHVTVYKAGGAVGILRHDERKPQDKIKARKNECIDPRRTFLNYSLSPVRGNSSLSEHVKRVCAKNGVRLSNRKDLNVMASWIVTLPPDVRLEDQEKFFKETYSFLCNRYSGEEFVLSSTVHLDETTPHLHHCFIPVAKGKDCSKTVSSKLCLTRGELRRFHKELAEHLMLSLGYYVSIQNEATLEGNKSIDQLKRDSAREMIEKIKVSAVQEAEKEANAIREKTVQEAARDVEEVRTNIYPLKEEKRALEADISQLKTHLKHVDELPKGKKAKIGNSIVLTPGEFQALRSAAEAYFSEQGKRLEAERNCQRLQFCYSESEKNSFESEYRKANSDNIALHAEIIRIQKAIDSLPIPDEMKRRVNLGQAVSTKRNDRGNDGPDFF